MGYDMDASWRFLAMGLVVGASATALGYELAFATSAREGARANEPSASTVPHIAGSSPIRRPIRGQVSENIAEPNADVPCRAKVRTLEREVTRLEQDLETQTALASVLQHDVEEREGVPLTWESAGLPGSYSPERFKETVAKAIEQCELPAEVVEIDCTQPPCILAMRVDRTEWRDNPMHKCAAWVDAFGQMRSQSNGNSSCPDGTSEWHSVMAPVWKGWGESGSDVWENAVKRWKTRRDELLSNWECKGGTPAEPRSSTLGLLSEPRTPEPQSGLARL